MNFTIQDARKLTLYIAPWAPIEVTLDELQLIYDRIGLVDGIIRHGNTVNYIPPNSVPPPNRG